MQIAKSPIYQLALSQIGQFLTKKISTSISKPISNNKAEEPDDLEAELHDDEASNDLNGLHKGMNGNGFSTSLAGLSNDEFLEKVINNELFKLVPEIGNVISIMGNTAASITNLFALPKHVQELGTYLGDLGTKIFLCANGTINGIEQWHKKNYLSSIGYFIENLVMAMVENSKVFLARGFVTGCYTLANGLSILNDQYEFDDLEDHSMHLIKGMKRSWKLLTEDPIRNLASSKTGLLSTISGLTMFAGSTIWKLTGLEKLGATFRDAGGLMQDVEQIKPEHMKDRPFYFISGIFVTLGTIFDYWSKFNKAYKNCLVPLSLLTDGLGRYFLRKSQLGGEMEQKTAFDILKDQGTEVSVY